MTFLAFLIGLPLAGFGLGLGMALGHEIAPSLILRIPGLVGPDPEAAFNADQTNVVHVDFRPGRYPLPNGGDAA
jgi:hypothetical protein